MSINLSSPTNATGDPLYHCFDSVNIYIPVAFTVTKVVVLLPLTIYVFSLGHQRWRQQQRSFKSTSHADVFTFHMAAMELINVAGWCLYSCGAYVDLPELMMAGFYAFFVIFPGQIFLHILTCVERYLAVVHPITYRGLKQSGGVRIRNMSTGCVWLLCCGWSGVTVLYRPDMPIIPFFGILIFSLLVVSFCSLSVLHVLIRPGPGEAGKDRVDQSKQRAFYTIVAIMGVLWLLFVGFLVCLSLDASPLLSDADGCVAMMSAIWFNLPSSLVSPLLFLHRAGKLPFFSSNAG